MGVPITDPYRWLEDSKSPATRAWIASQMKYTEDYLSQVKIRPEVVKRLTELMRVESYGIPVDAGNKYFFKKRLAEENQGSIYVREGLKGSDERLIDATKLSADQNTSVNIADVSKDGNLLVYDVREGGADEQSVHLLDVKTGGNSLMCCRRRGTPASISARTSRDFTMASSSRLVRWCITTGLAHPFQTDQMIFGKTFEGESFGPMDLIFPQVTENGRYLILHVTSRGTREASRYLREGLAHSGRADPADHSWYRQPFLAGELRG